MHEADQLKRKVVYLERQITQIERELFVLMQEANVPVSIPRYEELSTKYPDLVP
jgi:hypothetical protein